MNSLPIISLAAFEQDDRAAQEIQRLYDVCDEHGFFYIQDHGIDPSLVQQTIDASRDFFNLPGDVKHQYRQEVQTV